MINQFQMKSHPKIEDIKESNVIQIKSLVLVAWFSLYFVISHSNLTFKTNKKKNR